MEGQPVKPQRQPNVAASSELPDRPASPESSGLSGISRPSNSKEKDLFPKPGTSRSVLKLIEIHAYRRPLQQYQTSASCNLQMVAHQQELPILVGQRSGPPSPRTLMGEGQARCWKVNHNEVRPLGSKAFEKGRHPHLFLFNAGGSSLEKDTLGMYQSLLFQLFAKLPRAQEVFDGFDILELPQAPSYSWTIPQLKAVLDHAIRELGRHWLWIYVDALDECNEDQIRDMVAFFDLLGNHAVISNINMRVFFASRHYPQITTPKKVELTLEDEEEHSRDIERYIQSKLRTGNNTQNTAVQGIREEVKRRASGVFIWVVLVVEILNKAYDHGRIIGLEKKLQEIPDDLGQLFKGILTRDGQNMEDMRLCIQWILFAKRPLTREELYFAIRSGTDPEEVGSWNPEEITTKILDDFILSCSKGLAQLTQSESATVQFIHETIRDYLLKENGMQYIQGTSSQSLLGSGHDSLKQCCVNYISSTLGILPDSFARVDFEDVGALPFIAYALSRVFYHANVAEANGASQASFLQEFRVWPWIRLTKAFSIKESGWSYGSYSLDSSLLYILAEQNLKSLIEAMLRIDPRVDIDGERYGSPIRIALERRHYDALGALLAPGHANGFAGSPASLVRPPNRSEIDDLIYTYEHLSKRGTSDESVLYFFFQGGTESDIFTLLRSGRFRLDANISAAMQCSPLSFAAERGYETLVKFLLDKQDVNPDLQDSLGLTPLSKAAREGQLNIALLLVQGTKKVNVNSQCSAGRSPLSYAAEKGHEDVVELLLRQPDVELNLQDNEGRTPFFYAARRGREGIVRLLIKTTGVDIISRDSIGQTALSCAVLHRHEGVVRQLLNTGNVDINSQDNIHGRTPLSIALAFGYQSIAERLLEEPDIDVSICAKGGIDPDSKDSEYDRTPLSWAAANGYDAVVKLLLSKDDVDPDPKDAKDGRTPLSWAAAKGYDVVVKQLLAADGVDPNFKDTKYGRTPLWWAAERGHDAVVKLLLAKKGVDPDSKDTEHGQTPLSAAAGNGHKAVVKLLLANEGVNRDSEDVYGQTPLLRAIVKGHGSIVRMLQNM